MTLKKNLKTNKTKGQAALEYFVLFAIIASLTMISLSTFLPQVTQTSQTLFNAAANKILCDHGHCD